MRNWWTRFSLLVFGCFAFALTGCATMQSVGNSLAFWKKSPPKDQFATNPTSPSSSFSPTQGSSFGPGANQNNTNGFANTQSGSSPFGNTGASGSFSRNNATGSSSGGFAQTNPSGSLGNTRAPYNNQMPGGSGSFGSSNQNIPRTAQNPNMGRPSNPRSGFGGGDTGSGFNPSQTPNNRGFNTTTPSNQFRGSTPGFNPNAGKYVPNNSGGFGTSSNSSGVNGGATTTPRSNTMGSGNSGFSVPGSSPSGFSSPSSNTPNSKTPSSSSPTSGSNWNNYPSTKYPGFGSTSNTQSFQPSGSSSTFQSKNVPASANMTPPPSLPSSVFDKKGGYAPGSTGTTGKASQAGFETNSSSFSPTSGSKIPSSMDLYSPN